MKGNMNNNKLRMGNDYIAPGQEKEGLSYDPERPINEQIDELNRFEKAIEHETSKNKGDSTLEIDHDLE